MPIDNLGRWWPTADALGFNNPDVQPPEIPQDMHHAAVLELEAWHVQRDFNNLRRRPRAMPEEEAMNPNRSWLKKYPKLDVSKLTPVEGYNRGVALGKFKVEYDSHEQIQQKLHNTVILVRGHPFSVAGTIAMEDGKFALLLSNQDASLRWLPFDEIDDLRSMAPGYVNHNGVAYWVYRIPERQNQQGMSNRNTFLKPAGDGRASGMHNATMLACLQCRKNIPFEPNLINLMDNNVIYSIRLNNNVALYKVKNKGTSCGVEYIGRPLGLIVENKLKVLDDADLGPTWIHKDCNEVGLELF